MGLHMITVGGTLHLAEFQQTMKKGIMLELKKRKTVLKYE
jgi:hypothetical protein